MLVDIIFQAACLGELCHDDAVAFNARVHTLGKTAGFAGIGALGADAAGIPGQTVRFQAVFSHSLLDAIGGLFMGELRLKRLRKVHAVLDLMDGGKEKSSPEGMTSLPAFRDRADGRRTGPAGSVSFALQATDRPYFVRKCNLLWCQKTVFKHGEILNKSLYSVFYSFTICHR